MRQSELCIGLVELKPLARKAFGSAGAYTNIVTWACDLQSFRNKADEVAATVGMFVADVDWAESVIEGHKRNWSSSAEVRHESVRSTMPAPWIE